MARQRCIIYLIIVCSLPILATIITAFRIRDIASKSSAERYVSSRRNPLLEKCDGCGSVSEDRNNLKHLSVSALKVKEIASKRTYEDVKKAVREQQQTLNEKKLQQHKYQYLHEDSDEDDEDDDQEVSAISKSHLDERKQKSSHVKDMKLNITNKIYKPVNNLNSPSAKEQKHYVKAIDEASDDDNDDDDDDDEDVQAHTSQSKNKLDTKKDSPKKHIMPVKTSPVKKSILIEENSDDDDDDDDDDSDTVDSNDDSENDVGDHDSTGDEEDESDSDVLDAHAGFSKKQPDANKNVKNKRIEPANKMIVAKTKFIEVTNSDDDEDDIDDDEDGHKVGNKVVKLSTKISKPTKLEEDDNDDDIPLMKPTTIVPKPQASKLVHNEPPKNVQSKPESDRKKLATHNKDSHTNDSTRTMPIEKKVSVKGEPKKDKPQVDTKQEIKQNKDKEKSIKSAVDSKKDHKESLKEKIQDTKHNPKEEKIKDITKSEKDLEKKDEKKVKTKDHFKSDDKPTKHEKHEQKHQQAKDNPVLKHASDALHRKYFSQSEFEDFYAFLPSFAPNFSRIHNAECRRHGQILMRQLRGTKLWALNMLDASGKVSSGILQGNGNQLGNFDQCLESKARVRLESGHVVKIQGKYCLAQIDFKADDPELQLPIHLAQARNLLKSKIDDPGHFIPRFSSLNWGVCVPAACGPEDAELVLRDALRHYQHAGLHFRLNVDPLNCHTEDEEPWSSWLDLPTLTTLALFSFVLLVVLYATLNDFFAKRKDGNEIQDSRENDEAAVDEDATKDNKEPEGGPEQGYDEGIVYGFSLYRSGARLVRAGDAEDIACIHGVRAICSLALLLAHKIIPVATTPYTNRVQLTELSNTPLSYMLRVGWLYTDTFLLLSGALTAHRLSADLDGEGGMPWLRRFIARYVRLTPALLGVVLFYAYVWDKLGGGPQWGTLVSHNALRCQESWWWNLLYLQNFFAFDEMCAPQTYQLALDMQLTLTAGALVWLLRRRPLPGVGVLVALQAAAAMARYQATSEHRLSLLIYHGVSVSQMYRTARLSYTSALHRATPYLAGVALGVLLQRYPSKNISKLVLAPCWAACAACAAGALYAVADAAAADTRYSSAAAASYAALAPVAAATAIVWLIYTAHSGNAEWVNRFLCARSLVLISRLSYAMYLIQFVVFFYNAASVRGATEFSVLSILDAKEFATILAASAVVTLTLVIPMQSLSKYVMTYELSSKAETTDEPTENEVPDFEEQKDDHIQEAEEEIELLDLHEGEDHRNGRRIMAHRELLEEILEREVEYEDQRETRDEGLEEILEEEEDMIEEEMPEDMEMVEGEGEEHEGGEDNFWADRDADYTPRRVSRTDADQELDEWEWTATGQNSGVNYQYTR